MKIVAYQNNNKKQFDKHVNCSENIMLTNEPWLLTINYKLIIKAVHNVAKPQCLT